LSDQEAPGYLSESLLAAIVDSSDDGIIGETLDGSITSWNRVAEKMYGYSASEAIGRHISLLASEDHLAELIDTLARVGRGERVDSFETRRRCKDGSELDIWLKLSPIRDVTGTLIGVSSIARDITPRIKLELAHSALEGRLRALERLESLGQLAGGIAHDFNNLLAVIMNFASFVSEELDNKEAATADLEQICEAAERASDLTRQLLVFARQETHQSEILDLNEIISGIAHLIRGTVGEHIELTVSLCEGLGRVDADRGKLEQVLVNLAVNARDAMPGGGLLTIDTANVEIDDSYAEVHPGLAPGPYVRLRVSDTGTGMDLNVLEHAFEPFFTTKAKGEGTGLGLATVFGVVAQAAGSIELYSEPGQGTTCRILLPATDRAAAVITKPLTFEKREGNETVLIVEDEDALREVSRRILDRNGYNVLTSSNGNEAIEVAARYKGPIDLLLTDVVMPKMLGKEVARRICESRPSTAVLYMSGYAEQVLASRGILAAGVTLLDKPFSESSLLSKVREVLDAER